MKKLLAIFLLCTSCLLSGREWISLFESEITVHKDASMTVTETIVYEFEGLNKHGIFRDFPTRYKDRYKTWYDVVFDIKKITHNDYQIPYEKILRANGVRLKIGDPKKWLKPGKNIYKIIYKTDRQLGFYEDYDELYWNVTGQGWQLPIKKVIARVSLPPEIPRSAIQTDGYTGFFGAQNKDFTVKLLPDGIVQFESTKELRPLQGLTIVVIWPKGFINQPTFLTKVRYFFMDNLALFWLLFGLLLLMIYLYICAKSIRKKHHAGTIIPLFEPPKNMSAGAVRYVYKKQYDNKVFAAEIIQLAVEGFLQIIFKKQLLSGIYTLILKKPLDQSFAKYLFNGSSKVSLTQAEQTKIIRAKNALQQELKNKYSDYFKFYSGYFTVACLIGFITLFPGYHLAAINNQLIWFVIFIIPILGLILYASGFIFNVYSQKGQSIKDDIDGFKLYLQTAEKERLKIIGSPPTKTPELYETFLPYAVALGVEKQWSQQFAPLFKKMEKAGSPYIPIWYMGRPFNAYAADQFSSSLSQGLNSTISSASTPPGGSSGFGGSGGAGRGGGGGGGGSW